MPETAKHTIHFQLGTETYTVLRALQREQQQREGVRVVLGRVVLQLLRTHPEVKRLLKAQKRAQEGAPATEA